MSHPSLSPTAMSQFSPELPSELPGADTPEANEDDDLASEADGWDRSPRRLNVPAPQHRFPGLPPDETSTPPFAQRLLYERIRELETAGAGGWPSHGVPASASLHGERAHASVHKNGTTRHDSPSHTASPDDSPQSFQQSTLILEVVLGPMLRFEIDTSWDMWKSYGRILRHATVSKRSVPAVTRQSYMC